MQITILNVAKVPATTKGGKPYEVLDIAFKNLTFQGKVEGKKLMPFGANAGAFNVLKDAQSGQTYDINVVKNNQGYNDWTAANQSTGAQQAQQDTIQVYQPKSANASNTSPARANTFETPSERAAKQLSITRLATLNTAVAALTPGAKAALKPQEVLTLAKEFENYVYNIPSIAEDASGFDSMSEDVPD